MELGLKDHVVLVTGSSRGIGKAIAEAFLEEGARVVITGREAASLEKTREEFSKRYSLDKILVIQGDLTKDNEIQKCKKTLLKAWHHVDHLILNIGTGKSSTEILSSPEQWNFIFDENFNSSCKMVRAFLSAMQNRKKGNIVFIASITGKEAIGAPIDYSTAKAALIAFSKNLSRKVAQDGIRVNTVAPGNIFFPNGTWDEKVKQDKQKVTQMLESRVPMKRLGTPQEVAASVLFLSSQKASFITGAVLTVDGGQTCAALG